MTTRSDTGALSAQRIWERCEALSRHSELAGGLTRVYLSAEQRAANELVMRWMREAGMSARLDAVGNVMGRYEAEAPGAPCLMLGSHLDTVRDAGKYDGMLGVIAAIECVHALNARGRRLAHAIEVAGFADEEGVRFNATLIGSRALAGTLDAAVLEARDAAGISLREALAAFGLDPAGVRAAERRRGEVLAYAELHIEQGPVLESEGLPVGVVSAINGGTRHAVEIEGMAGHAGTVPMALRQDALAAAAECVLAVERRCRAEAELVGTVGKLECLPGAVNVVPGRVRFTIDLRAPRDAARIAAERAVLAEIQRVCAARKVKLRVSKTHECRTASCAPWLQEQIGEAIAAERLPVRRLASGAGHDGTAIVELADIGMLFVRCARGISHNPAEAVTLDDVATGARVLLRFAERFDPGRRPQ